MTQDHTPGCLRTQTLLPFRPVNQSVPTLDSSVAQRLLEAVNCGPLRGESLVLFPAVLRDYERSTAPCLVPSTGPLNLDNLGTEISPQVSAVRSGDMVGEV